MLAQATSPHLRERFDALGTLAHVVDADSEVGDGEDEFGLLAVRDAHHVVRVPVQRQDLVPGLQVPDLSRPVCERWET